MAASDKPQVVQPGDKARAIETVVAHIEKQFGRGAIMLSDGKTQAAQAARS